MLREEFESLAMANGESIPQVMYEQIEYFYMADNDYHAQHGGVDEDQASFVLRVFGGKVNTKRSVLAKLVKETIRENRWALRGNPSCTASKLRQMDRVILFHHRWMVG